MSQLKKEITIQHQKATAVLLSNTILKEVIVAKAVVDIVLMVLILKLTLQKNYSLDAYLMTYKVKGSNTHHRIDIRYP